MNTSTKNMVAMVSIDTSKVSRVEVIDHSKDGEGRVYTKWDVKVELSLQDSGRTLKVFVS